MAAAKDIHREMADAWNRRDFQSLRNLLHSDYSYTGGDGQEHAGPESGLAVAQLFANAFPDGRLTVRQSYTAGNTAIAEMIGTGTQNGEFLGIAPTGRSISITICNVMELKDGKIYREREYFDMLTIMTQLGAVRAPGQAAGR